MTTSDDQELERDEFYLTRKANLQKATQIRQAGYKSSIHALPLQVRAKLDQFLTWKLSPKKALAALCEHYPKIELPSPKAVENYRNKYHKISLTKKTTLVARSEADMDLVKAKLQKRVLAEIEYITFKILPRLVRRVEKALDKEDQVGLPLSITNSSILTATKVIKMLSDFLAQNDIYLFVQQKAVIETVKPEEEEVDMNVVYAKLADIMQWHRTPTPNNSDSNVVVAS